MAPINPFESSSNPFDDDDDKKQVNKAAQSELSRKTSSFMGAPNAFFDNLFTSQQEGKPSSPLDQAALEKKKRKMRRRMLRKKPNLQRWPHDNYHEEQKKYYESLAQNLSDDSDSSNEKPKRETQFHSLLRDRPMELRPIEDAAKHLHLLAFDQDAKMRSINILTTWMCDYNLIDDVIQTGRPKAKEIGLHGYVHSENHFEKEMEKLKLSTQKELSLVNTRLNEGVAATGAEVKELVESVKNAKKDIMRLDELSTCISPGNGSESKNKLDLSSSSFILAPYPKLQKMVWARRNIQRCFRDIDFFANISGMCEKLTDRLYVGEYTKDEWNNIRSVCMDHVEIEIQLVEAKTGLEVLLEQNKVSKQKKIIRTSNKSNNQLRNLDALEKFLTGHVKEVWEIGNEIQAKIKHGMTDVFELAVNNSAGMVALVESVEVYERAIEQFQTTMHSKRKHGLEFTSMRSAALAELYDKFWDKGQNIFTIALEKASGEDSKLSSFDAVFDAADSCFLELYKVKDVSVCFPESWAIEILWTTCVAHLCSNQIMQQIGGPEGTMLPDLTVTHLLDVVLWVEKFGNVMNDNFPQLAEMKSPMKEYFDIRPDLLGKNTKVVDKEKAFDSLAWCNNLLWEIHRLAQEEFLMRIRTQADTWLANAYEVEHSKTQTHEGRLKTSLCEDLFSLVILEYKTLKEHLSTKSDGLPMAICIIFEHLFQKQKQYRDKFLNDLQSCCAAANDFSRMSEKCEEDVFDEMMLQSEFSDDVKEKLEESSSELLTLYASDSVYAAQMTHRFIFQPISEMLGIQFFTPEWEEDTHNKLAQAVVETIKDFMNDLEEYLEFLLWKKSVEALVSATVVFYIRFLLLKAESHSNYKVSAFDNVEVAMNRMADDQLILRGYFESLEERHPVLGRHIDKDFDMLKRVHECMLIAAGLSHSDAEDFIPIMNKYIGDPYLTQHFFGDIWRIINPMEERNILDLVASMEDQLVAMSEVDYKSSVLDDLPPQPGIQLDDMLVELYSSSKRKLPVYSTLKPLRASLL